MPKPDSSLLTSWVEELVREVQRRQSELQDAEAKRVSQDLPKKLYRTLSAFANREGGGSILLGIDETAGFAVSGVNDVAAVQRDMLNFVQTEMSYPIRLEITVADVDGAQVVGVTVMEAPFSQKPVYYRKLGLDKGSFRRSGTSNVQMTPEEVRQLITAQAELREDFTSRLVSTLPDDWFDPIEVERIRRLLAVTRRGSELERLSVEELLSKLQLTESAGGRQTPTVAGLLLAGREPFLKQHVNEHEIILLDHGRESEEYDKRSDMKCALVSVLEAVETHLEASNRIASINVGLIRYEIPRFHRKVYREALLNAVIHRNYADYGSIMVRVFPSRLQISNPGGFLPGVTPDNILTGAPKHRNRRLAEAFQILGLVERAGMGVAQMYRHQLENGKPAPHFSGTESEVRISISTDLVDEKMAAFVASQYRGGHKFDVGDLLVLNQLRSQREVRTSDVARITQRNQPGATALLNDMVKKDLLRRRGFGASTVYSYSPSINRALGNAPQAARDKIIESVRHPEMIVEYVRQQGSIGNHECQVLCDLNSWQASRLLRKLTDSGLLWRSGPSKKLARYELSQPDEA